MTERREYLECVIAGQPVVLMPERALYCPTHETLVVADLHWGKAASMRANYVPVPTGTTAADLARLDAALDVTGAKRLVVLGDLLHAKDGRQEGTFGTIAAWRARHDALDIVLVRGNHDESAGDPPETLGITCQDAPWTLGTFTCVHDTEEDFADGAFVLGGHVHPSISLSGRGRQRVRLPCFVFSETAGILPAFSSFTGGGMYEYVPGDRLFVIADGEVMPVTSRHLPA